MFRERLAGLGMDVRFPAGDSIIEYAEGFAITVPHEQTTPFSQTEQAFMDSIGTSDVHIVYNLWGEEDGYVGESTAIETIQAIAHNVPTVWLRQPRRLSPHITGRLKALTERSFEYLPWIEPLDRMPDKELVMALGQLAGRKTGVHPWSAPAPRPAYANGIYTYGPGDASNPQKGGDYLWPVINEYEEELFLDIKLALIGSYDAAWQRYQGGISAVR